MKLRSAFIFGCMCWAILFAGCLPASASRQVVLLFDERIELPGLALLEAELIRNLRSNSAEPIEVYRETMDLSRFGTYSYKTSFRDFLRTKYADKKIDVAVAIMAPAFEFLVAYGDLIFPGTPIVFAGLDHRQLGNRSLPANVLGVLIERKFAPTLELVFRLHPTIERVVVVSGASEFDASLLSNAKEQFRPYEDRVSVSYLSDLSLKQLLERLSKLPARDVVLFITMLQDSSGQPLDPHEVVEQVSRAASVPVYGFLDQYIGRGIVGGSLYNSSAIGAETAKIVLSLLKGATPPQKIVEVVGNKVAFDWRQMQRWGIDETDLPPGSQIYFRGSTLWQRYPWQIAFVVAVILIQAGLITILLSEHRRRRVAEVQARQRMSELAHVNRFSTAGELAAAVAHEINQPLGAILTNAETAQSMLKAPHPDIDELNNIVNDILHDDRRAGEVIRRMRSLLKKAPSDPRKFDFNELAQETVEFLSSLAIAREVELGSLIALDALPVIGDRIQLQQVILNLVVNAMDAMANMPSVSRRISIRTSRIDNFAELSISDTGPGVPAGSLKGIFEPFFTTKTGGMGVGLSIARTIVEAHDGRIWAENHPGTGASFRIRLPLEGASPAA